MPNADLGDRWPWHFVALLTHSLHPCIHPSMYACACVINNVKSDLTHQHSHAIVIILLDLLHAPSPSKDSTLTGP